MVCVSVPDGQDSTVQSWMPFMKSILVHRHTGSPAPLGQPRLGAFASMFLTHVCYRDVSDTPRQI